MSDPTKQENYYHGPVGDTFIRPTNVRLRASFSSGAATLSTTRRQSAPGAAISGSAGSYSVTGLPTGSDYHIKGCALVLAGATPTVFHADVTAFDAGAGTLSFVTRQIGYDGSQPGAAVATSAAASPPDNSQIHISLDVETGVYS